MKDDDDVLIESFHQALKMSCIQVVAFIVFWTPYTVMATWSVILKHFIQNINYSIFLSISGQKNIYIMFQSAYIIS